MKFYIEVVTCNCGVVCERRLMMVVENVKCLERGKGVEMVADRVSD